MYTHIFIKPTTEHVLLTCYCALNIEAWLITKIAEGENFYVYKLQLLCGYVKGICHHKAKRHMDSFPVLWSTGQVNLQAYNLYRNSKAAVRIKDRFPFKRNRLRCVRCVNENRKKRKRSALALVSSQSWLPLLRPIIRIGWRLRLLRENFTYNGSLPLYFVILYIILCYVSWQINPLSLSLSVMLRGLRQ